MVRIKKIPEETYLKNGEIIIIFNYKKKEKWKMMIILLKEQNQCFRKDFKNKI